MDSVFGLVLFAKVAIELAHSELTCERPILPNGVVDIRSHTAYYSCEPYKLIGRNNSTCVNGKWNRPTPFCAKPGCAKPNVENAVVSLEGYKVTVNCNEGFTLAGHFEAYCNGIHWNHPLGTCLDKTSIAVSCDFENENMCGWTNGDSLNKWTRYSSLNASRLRVGPDHDHTTMQTDSGHFMLIEFNGAVDATLTSPGVYPAELSKGACFQFWYFSYGNDSVLTVYQTKLGNSFKSSWKKIYLDDYKNDTNWKLVSFPLKTMNENFQIEIHNYDWFKQRRNKENGIAIDDVKLMRGSDCSRNKAVAPTSPTTTTFTTTTTPPETAPTSPTTTTTPITTTTTPPVTAPTSPTTTTLTTTTPPETSSTRLATTTITTTTTPESTTTNQTKAEISAEPTAKTMPLASSGALLDKWMAGVMLLLLYFYDVCRAQF